MFLFPWGVVFDQLGWTGYCEGTAVHRDPLLGGVYAWRKRALEWR